MASTTPPTSSEHTRGWNSTADEVWNPDGSAICLECRHPWPCEPSVLTEALAAARARAAALEDALNHLLNVLSAGASQDLSGAVADAEAAVRDS